MIFMHDDRICFYPRCILFRRTGNGDVLGIRIFLSHKSSLRLSHRRHERRGVATLNLAALIVYDFVSQNVDDKFDIVAFFYYLVSSFVGIVFLVRYAQPERGI